MPDVYSSNKQRKIKDKSHGKNDHKDDSGHTYNPLAAYCYYPDKVKFVATDSEERIVLLLRKHPITNIPWILTAIFMLFIPVFISLFSFIDLVPLRFVFFGSIIWYLIVIAFVFEEFLSWYFNVNIVTDERVFDVDFVNLLYREITDANIDQIQDVTTAVGGAIRTVFGYGDILIQTASETPNIDFEAVPKPDEVASVLRDLRVEEEIEKIEGRVR